MSRRIRYPYPPFPDACRSARDQRHYRNGFRWGYRDGLEGKTWAICGSWWTVEGYSDGNAAARGASHVPQSYESRSEVSNVA